MKLEIRADHQVAMAFLRGYAERRTRAALERFERDVTGVAVDVGDANGPRGGPDDKYCRISAHVPGVGAVFAKSAASDVDAAVDRAAERIERAVARAIARARGRTNDTLRNTASEREEA